jgi:hypothetical protein
LLSANALRGAASSARSFNGVLRHLIALFKLNAHIESILAVSVVLCLSLFDCVSKYVLIQTDCSSVGDSYPERAAMAFQHSDHLLMGRSHQFGSDT